MIRMLKPDLDFLPIPDPGTKKAPDPGSRTRIRDTSFTVPVTALHKKYIAF
jgi:hypothetical protein